MEEVDRTKLVEICSELNSHDVAALKYLVQDDLHRADLEKCSMAIEVFELLEHSRGTDIIKLVSFCLSLMDKPRLIRGTLHKDPDQIKLDVENDTSTIKPFRKSLFKVAQNMLEEEVNRLLESMKLQLSNMAPAIRLLDRTNPSERAFELFNILEKRQKISSDDSSFLCEMLNVIRRPDLQSLIQSYKDNFEDKYQMDAGKRGLCLIVNNRKFDDEVNFSERKGSDKDADALKRTFGQLNFEIVLKCDQKAMEILDFIHSISAMDHSKYNALIVCILSHGDTRLVNGVDGKPVYFVEITDPFMSTKCRTLSGKPKIFFIQACQGHIEHVIPRRSARVQSPRSQRDIGVLPPEPEEATHEIPMDDDDEIDIDPDKSDMLLAYSTVPGYSSYRDDVNGSLYIQAVCREISERCMSDHLEDILTHVNKQLSGKVISVDGKKVKTTALKKSTLRKKIYFFPENR